MTRSYIFKLIHSPYIYASMTAILGICVLLNSVNLGGRFGLSGGAVNVDITSLLQTVGFRRFFLVLGSVPFAANFADEWNSKAITNCVTRTSTRSYSASNAAFCFVSTFVTVTVPLVIFAALDCCIKTVWDERNGPDVSYGSFQTMGLPFLTVVFVIYGYAIACAMWSVTGLTLSAFFPSKFIAIGAPFVLCTVFEEFTARAPVLLNFEALTNSRIWDNNNNWLPDHQVFLYTTFFFVGLSALCGILFTKAVEKKVRNELG